MILYNTLMGFCAGVLLLLTSRIVNRFGATRGDGIALIVLGIPLTLLSSAMALTWPLTVNPPINIAFSEPALMLGVLALVGGIMTLRYEGVDMTGTRGPIHYVIGALGLMMLALSIAIFRFNLVGDAPPIEPISGQVTGWENTVFALVYLSVAIGCFGAWFSDSRAGVLASVWGWRVAGVFFLVFSCLNYYTHIGLLTCTGTGVCHSF